MLKRFFLLSVLLLGVERTLAFSLLGPINEAYQSPVIAYNGLGAPKNIGEEYRQNRRVVYYSANQSFLDYFGSNGLYAVEGAFQVMNSLTNVSAYSGNLAEVPMEAMRDNYLAQALGLLDLKSQTLELLVEQMGLAEPERYVWALHNRFTAPGGQCPQNQIYDVIKRNFDPVTSNQDQLQVSSYVNGTLYSYTILEACTGPNPLADAVEFAVDPTARTFTAVASRGALYGNFYSGVTRDDIGGLRYLLRTNNYNFENAGAETITFLTNATAQLLFTSNLFEFVTAALTNNAAALSALYPDLQIASTAEIFTNVVSTNVVFYFTNYPFEPYGTPPHLITASVLQTNITSYYNHTFVNAYITPSYQLTSNFQVPVVPGHSVSNGMVTTITTNISSSACGPFSPAGSICTNVSVSQSLTPGFFGDFYILPSNLCSVAIVSTQLVINVTVTNEISGVIVVFTNTSGGIEAVDSLFSQTPIYSFNQYVYQVRPVFCPQNTVGLRQGIERVQFVRRDFDSLLGRFFYPVTNDYPMVILTNNTLVTQIVRRVVTTPDILVDAEDLSPGPSQNLVVPILARSIVYDQGNVLPGLAGPGKIDPGAVFTFNKVGPIYQNLAPNFLDEAGQTLWFIWGSFDGTTNAPIVYPNGTDILNLENQLLIQISPVGPALPSFSAAGTTNYSTVFSGFTVSGGATAPYSWSLVQGLGTLPPGLLLNASTGQIAGDPTTQGIYDFTVRMNDSVGRFVDRNYTITITP